MPFGDPTPERIERARKRQREAAQRYQGKREREARATGKRSTLTVRNIPAKYSKGFTPASKEQREARDEVGYCIACGRTREFDGMAIDPAHLVSRQHGGCDSRFCTVPLCRPCHRAFDDGDLDLLAVLVGDWNRWRHHVQHALRHELPVPLLERLAGARTQWSDDPRRVA